MENNNRINGISVCNPVDIERDYLLYTVDYAIRNGIDHLQFIGPIHDPVKGNIDGMTIYHKYSQFNDSKDLDYIEKTTECVNEACEKAHQAGIKTYVWHHELEVPPNFLEAYPEICNSFGDAEITHPIIRDFIENKLLDFFNEYPLMDGIILTLHETRIPLLKLKNQKLDKKDRVKYVTQILYETCKRLGKELIVRTFASIEEDYEMMLSAFEEISSDLLVMDKWTQFDWSLTAPHNRFFNKVKNNPLFIETDIFGEYFGKGALPLMLKNHIKEKIEYCEGFSPAGYVSRIDRGGRHPFGGVNEINLHIMNAYMRNQDVDSVIESFFEKKYPSAAREIMCLMNETEEVLKGTIYLKGYYFSELSIFPSLNHSKNHFYFEMMRNNSCIASNEWFVPDGWERGSIEGVLQEKNASAEKATELFASLESLKGRIEEDDYSELWKKFANLKYVTILWRELTKCFVHYARYFETMNEEYREMLLGNIEELRKIDREASSLIGEWYYCNLFRKFDGATDGSELVKNFTEELFKTLIAEEKKTKELKERHLTDFVVCGGATEGHKLQKEVNFSDTYLFEEGLCRMPGSGRGKAWSMVNSHGWFSYELAVKPDCENLIRITAGSSTDTLNLQVTIDDEKYTFSESIEGKKELILSYVAAIGKESVRIRFDRTAADNPYIYTITVE